MSRIFGRKRHASKHKKETVELLIPFIDRVLEPHEGRLLEGWVEGSAIFNEEE
jgi:hypothetical protein